MKEELNKMTKIDEVKLLIKKNERMKTGMNVV